MLNLEKTVVFRRKGINIKKTLLGPVVCKMNLRWNQGPFIPKLHILSFNKQRKKPGLVRPPKEQTTSGKISPCGDGKPGHRQLRRRWSERRLICCIDTPHLQGVYIYIYVEFLQFAKKCSETYRCCNGQWGKQKSHTAEKRIRRKYPTPLATWGCQGKHHKHCLEAIISCKCLKLSS